MKATRMDVGCIGLLFIAAFVFLTITGCTRTNTAVEFPALPDLPAEVKRPCPELPPVTGSLGDLAAKDAGAAIEYARCQSRHAAAVGAYETARRMLDAAATQQNGKKGDTVPGKPR